jgi:hypothetical protein
MINWKLWSRGRDRNWEKQLKALQQKLEAIERKLADAPDQGHSVHITVEHVHLDRAVLEQLTFQLDKLDIKDLSGSLNIGNNFGEKPKLKADEKPKAEAKKRSMEEEETGRTPVLGVTPTASGYSYRRS